VTVPCGPGGEPGEAFERLAAGGSGGVAFSGLGVKNACGDNADVTWSFLLRNATDVGLNNVNLVIDCPAQGSTYGGSGSPTAPGAK
jgi:hypothetical protein